MLEKECYQAHYHSESKNMLSSPRSCTLVKFWALETYKFFFFPVEETPTWHQSNQDSNPIEHHLIAHL